MSNEESYLFVTMQLRFLAIKVAEGIRNHPDVEGGVSVRGTLSFLEVLSSLESLYGKISVEMVYDAAYATFVHRIRPRGLRSAEEIMREVLDELLLGKQTPQGLRLDLQSGNKEFSSALSELIQDLMTLSVAHKYHLDLKRELSAGVFPQDLAGLLADKEKKDASRSYLPNLSQVLHNGYNQPTQEGIKTPSAVGMELLDNLERFDLMKQDVAKKDEGKHMFTQNSANLVGEGTTRKILGEYYEELVDNESSNPSAIFYSMSRDDLTKLLNELQALIDLKSERPIPSFDSLVKFYRDQFPTLAEALAKLSSVVFHSEPKPYEKESPSLMVLLEALKQARYLESKGSSLKLSTRAYELIFEDMLPEVERATIYGEHESQRVCADEGETVDIRKYRPSDRFQDISVRATLRELVKHHRRNLERGYLRVNQTLPTKSLSIALAIDSSSSMAPRGKLLYAKKAAVGLALAAAKKDDYVGVLAFSDYAKEISAFTSKVDSSFLRRVAELRPLNSTNVEGALKRATSILTRQELEGQKHIILVTDGVPTVCNDLLGVYPSDSVTARRISSKAALKQAERCRLMGITISTICIDRDEHVDREFCKNLSRIGKGRHYFLRDERELPRTTLHEYHRVRDQ